MLESFEWFREVQKMFQIEFAATVDNHSKFIDIKKTRLPISGTNGRYRKSRTLIPNHQTYAQGHNRTHLFFFDLPLSIFMKSSFARNLLYYFINESIVNG